MKKKLYLYLPLILLTLSLSIPWVSFADKQNDSSSDGKSGQSAILAVGLEFGLGPAFFTNIVDINGLEYPYNNRFTNPTYGLTVDCMFLKMFQAQFGFYLFHNPVTRNCGAGINADDSHWASPAV